MYKVCKTKYFFGFDKTQIYHFTMRVGGCEYGMVLSIAGITAPFDHLSGICRLSGGWWLVAGG